MSIYIYILLELIILSIVANPSSTKEKPNSIGLLVAFVSMYAVMAMKAPSVGRDVSGYKSIYEMISLLPAENYDVSWMENGFEFLMMISSHVLHLQFQSFMACVYAFAYLSYYCFIKRYSKDPILSTIVYLCFTFFTFDCSAIRNMLAVSICLNAVRFTEDRNLASFILFLLITLCATSIHKSAFVFLLFYPIARASLHAGSIAAILFVVSSIFLLRTQLYQLIDTYLKTVEESAITIGGNLIFYLSVLVFAYNSSILTIRKLNERKTNQTIAQTDYIYDAPIVNSEEKQLSKDNEKLLYDIDMVALKAISTGILLQLFASGSVLSRSAQYYQFFIIIALPNSLESLDRKSKWFLRVLIILFCIAYFIRYSLIANQLDIVPYAFYWSV